MTETSVYRVADMDDFTAKIAKLNKRAAKLNVAGVTYAVVGTELEYHVVWDALMFLPDSPPSRRWTTTPDTLVHGAVDGQVRTITLVTVNGNAPKLAGWTFVGVVQDGGEAGNVLRTVPGSTCPERFRSTEPYACDHCGLDRRRRETFVVVNDDGRDAQVGRTCLKDFTGHKSPETIAAYADLLASFDPNSFYSDEDGGGFGGGGGGRERAYSRKFLVEHAVAAIQKYGWTPRSKRDFAFPTADLVLDILDPPKGGSKFSVEITDEVRARATSVVEWAESLQDRNDLGDYLWNLRVVMASEGIDWRGVGLAVSAVTAYEREMEGINRSALAAAARAAMPVSKHVGTVGAKVTLTATLVRVVNIDGAYGVSHLMKLVDGDGNDLAWFASGRTPWDTRDDYDVGGTRKVTGTVKKLDEYQGRLQTVLTRVTLAK